MSSALFSPIKVGDITLSHRVALAALTRLRSAAFGMYTIYDLRRYNRRNIGEETKLIVNVGMT